MEGYEEIEKIQKQNLGKRQGKGYMIIEPEKEERSRERKKIT